jgi:hypothetical protein
VDADHRSALPRVPGIPWWGAVLLAATAAAVGFAFDAGAGNKELSAVFAVCYVIGCVLAILAVRQSGVFTAVIQPPLILFFAVPGAYFLFHGSTIGGLKDILINCGYPLIERFPLMFITSAVVLTIGMVRWYLGVVARRAAPADAEADASEVRPASKGAAAETTVMDAVEATPRRKRREHSIDRPARAAAAEAAGTATEEPIRRPRKAPKSAPVAGASRSRHVRPPEPEPDFGEPPTSRPRRRPAAQAGPPVDPPVEPRRRPRPPQPREPRRNLPPIDGRGAHERPERHDRPLRSERPERSDRPERRRRPSGHEPYEPPYDSYEPRPSEPRPTNGANGSHHPVSRVRYRGDDDGESRTEYRTRPRRPRGSDADSWEFDV